MNPVKLVFGFAPLAVFALVGAWIPIQYAALIGVVLAIVAIVIGGRSRAIPVLPIVTGVTLVVIAVLGFVSGASFHAQLTEYGRGAASVVLALFILMTAPFAPFTAQFARSSVPEKFWHSGPFLALNRRISSVWGVAVLITGIAHLVSGVLGDHVATIEVLALNWVIPAIAIVLAFQFTKRAASAASAADAHAARVTDAGRAE